MRTWRTFVAAAALGVLLAGCAGGSSDEGAVTTSTVADPTSTTSTTTTAPSSTTAPSTTTIAAPTLADAFAETSSGVFRVGVELCDGSLGGGTAFLVGRERLVTAAHVVQGATSVLISRDDGVFYEVDVVGFDRDRDVALLAAPVEIDGHVFEVADDGLRVGDEVAVLGHPIGLPLTFTSGRLSQLDFVDGGVPFHQTDAAINPGNSGGPVIDATGRAVGMASWVLGEAQGLGFAVAADEVAAMTARPPTSVDLARACATTTAPPPSPAVDPVTEVAATVETYIALVGSGGAVEAYEWFAGPRIRSRQTLDEFVAAFRTTSNTAVAVWDAWLVGPDEARAIASFTSYQDPALGPNGQSCSHWDLTYELVRTDHWRIQGATNAPGSPLPC